MKLFKSRKFSALTLFILLFIAAAVAFLFTKEDRVDRDYSPATEESTDKKPDKPGVKTGTTEKEPEKIPSEPRKKVTEETLKEKYGRIEVIELYNGEIYSGAVVSTGDIFLMETVHGHVEIPEKSIRVREIVR